MFQCHHFVMIFMITSHSSAPIKFHNHGLVMCVMFKCFFTYANYVFFFSSTTRVEPRVGNIYFLTTLTSFLVSTIKTSEGNFKVSSCFTKSLNKKIKKILENLLCDREKSDRNILQHEEERNSPSFIL